MIHFHSDYRLVALFAAATLTMLSTPAVADTDTSYKLMQRGYASLQQGLGQQAIVQFTQAIQADPANLSARRYLATAQLACGQAQAALEVMKPTVQAEPSADNLCCLGDAYLALGNASTSARQYSAALKLSPNHVDAVVGLANVYMQSQEYEAAQKLCYSAMSRTKSQADYARLQEKLEQIQRCLHTVEPASS